MCVKQFFGYSCGHCSIPTLIQCPLASSNPLFPTCGFPAERPIFTGMYCHPCFRVVWNFRVLKEEEEHRERHMKGECFCEVRFEGEDRDRHLRARAANMAVEGMSQGQGYVLHGAQATAPNISMMGQGFPQHHWQQQVPCSENDFVGFFQHDGIRMADPNRSYVQHEGIRMPDHNQSHFQNEGIRMTDHNQSYVKQEGIRMTDPNQSYFQHEGIRMTEPNTSYAIAAGLHNPEGQLMMGEAGSGMRWHTYPPAPQPSRPRHKPQRGQKAAGARAARHSNPIPSEPGPSARDAEPAAGPAGGEVEIMQPMVVSSTIIEERSP